jgi:uncharacterized membrane protein
MTKNLPILLTAVLVACATVLFSQLGIKRYQSTFSYDWRDEAVNNQMMYNTAKGDFLLSTIKGTHRHHRHFRPMFLPASLAYLLTPDARAWYIEAALILALGAFAAFSLGSRLLGGPWSGFLAAMLWLLWPPLREIGLNNMDPEIFAATFWLFAASFYAEKRFGVFFLCAILAVCCKETQAPVLAAFGVVALIQRRPRVWWLSSILVGSAWFLIAVKLIIPSYHPTFDTVYNRFIGVDGTDFPGGFLRKLAGDFPGTLALIFSKEHLSIVRGILRPLGYLAVFSPVPLIGLGPILLQMFLLKDPLPVRQAHMLTAMVPFAFWATLDGARQFGEWLSRLSQGEAREKVIAWRMLLFLLISTSVYFSSLPGIFGLYQNYGQEPLESLRASNMLDPAFRTPTAAEKRAAEAVSRILPGEVVVANSRLLLLLSSRSRLYEFGLQNETGDFAEAQAVALWFLKAECRTCTYSEWSPESLRLAGDLVESGRFGVAVFDPAFAIVTSSAFPPKNYRADPSLKEAYLARLGELSERLTKEEGLPPDEPRTRRGEGG